jgi:hypothetical protein
MRGVRCDLIDLLFKPLGSTRLRAVVGVGVDVGICRGREPPAALEPRRRLKRRKARAWAAGVLDRDGEPGRLAAPLPAGDQREPRRAPLASHDSRPAVVRRVRARATASALASARRGPREYRGPRALRRCAAVSGRLSWRSPSRNNCRRCRGTSALVPADAALQSAAGRTSPPAVAIRWR